MKKPNHETIYLIPGSYDGEHCYVWSDDPAPGAEDNPADAVAYIRADLVPESNAVLSERIADLTRKNSWFIAQADRFRGGLNQAIELLVTALNEPQQITESEIHDLRTLEQSTPAQCLAEMKAQARQDAVEQVLNHFSDNFTSNGLTIDWAIARCDALINQGFDRIYIEAFRMDCINAKEANISQLRQQAKVGE